MDCGGGGGGGDNDDGAVVAFWQLNCWMIIARYSTHYVSGRMTMIGCCCYWYSLAGLAFVMMMRTINDVAGYLLLLGDCY